MKRNVIPHPWSVWVDKQRIATTLRAIDAATVAVLHGKGTRVRFIEWVVGTVRDDDANITAFAREVYRAAIIKQSNALGRLKRTPTVGRAERRRSA
jgi:hypothetical protein